MKLAVDDITDAPTHLEYAEDVDDLNRRLERGTHDYVSRDKLGVELTHYRAGADVVLSGTVTGRLRATCARCLEEFDLPLDVAFTHILAPRPARADEAADEDLALGFYEGDEIDLAPIMHEQALLSLPTRPLCRDDCRGLCPGCGANLNDGPCACPAQPSAGPLAGLAELVRGK